MVTEPGGGNMVPLAQVWKNGARDGSDFLPQWLRAAQDTVISVLKKERRKNRCSVCRFISLRLSTPSAHICGANGKCWGVSDLVLEESKSLWGKNVNVELQAEC